MEAILPDGGAHATLLEKREEVNIDLLSVEHVVLRLIYGEANANEQMNVNITIKR